VTALGDDVLALAERGWLLHPLRGNAATGNARKRPHLERWPELATTDVDQLERWAAEYRGCWWGIATGRGSGVVVWDIDDLAACDAWLAEHGYTVPSTPTSITLSGGRHYYFLATADPLGNWSKRIPGTDFRGDGGYVVAVTEGSPYRWAATLSPDDVELAELPEWLAAAGRTAPSRSEATPADEWSRVVAGPIPAGARNATLARVAGLLFRRLPATVAADLAELWAAHRCTPPLPEREIRRTIASIAMCELQRRNGGAR